jgi:hypothetical protein
MQALFQTQMLVKEDRRVLKQIVSSRISAGSFLHTHTQSTSSAQLLRLRLLLQQALQFGHLCIRFSPLRCHLSPHRPAPTSHSEWWCQAPCLSKGNSSSRSSSSSSSSSVGIQILHCLPLLCSKVLKGGAHADVNKLGRQPITHVACCSEIRHTSS